MSAELEVPFEIAVDADAVEEADESEPIEDDELVRWALLRGPGANILPTSSWLTLPKPFWLALTELHPMREGVCSWTGAATAVISEPPESNGRAGRASGTAMICCAGCFYYDRVELRWWYSPPESWSIGAPFPKRHTQAERVVTMQLPKGPKSSATCLGMSCAVPDHVDLIGRKQGSDLAKAVSGYFVVVVELRSMRWRLRGSGRSLVSWSALCHGLIIHCCICSALQGAGGCSESRLSRDRPPHFVSRINFYSMARMSRLNDSESSLQAKMPIPVQQGHAVGPSAIDKSQSRSALTEPSY